MPSPSRVAPLFTAQRCAALICAELFCAPALTPTVAGAQAPTYRVEELAAGLKAPWSLAFLPDSSILIVEKHGGVRRFRSGRLDSLPIAGTPTNVLQRADGGLLDLALDPAFASNHLVYLSFAEGTLEANRTALYRARWNGSAFEDGQVIFRAAPIKRGTGHFGSRIAWLPDATLLLTIGDGYDYLTDAQALGSDLGKIVRLTRDGRPASDNPFVSTPGARPEIYSFGHRNAQGLLVDPRTGEVWAHEHGPKGGDEINRVRAGGNYGWPRTTFGIDYDNTVISPLAEAPGIERPSVVWVPSIAPSGFALYLGNRFPGWTGDFFVGALAGKHLRRVRIRPGQPVEQEVLLTELGQRIREVRAGPDGLLYLLTDEAPGRLLRLRPGGALP